MTDHEPLAWLTSGGSAIQWSRLALELVTRRELVISLLGPSGAHSIAAAGPCPRCGHDVAWQSPLDAVASLGVVTLGLDRGHLSDLADDEPPRRIDVICSCAADHPGRPKGTALGCGITFRLVRKMPS